MGREETGKTDQNTKKRKGRPALTAAMVICIGVMIFWRHSDFQYSGGGPEGKFGVQGAVTIRRF